MGHSTFRPTAKCLSKTTCEYCMEDVGYAVLDTDDYYCDDCLDHFKQQGKERV